MKLVILLIAIGCAFGDLNCPVNSHFNSCGTDCPLTCENYQNPPIFCNYMCRIGCECDDGYVLTSDRGCVLPEDCESSPSLPGTVQNCTTLKVTSHSIEVKCEEGSNGGSQQFFLMEVHDRTSSSLTLNQTSDMPAFLINDLPPDTWFILVIFAVNAKGRSRLPFVLQTHTLSGEQTSLQNAKYICRQPPLKGPCRGLFPRFYYNQQSKLCERFDYGGCHGNNNNFETLEECSSTCSVLNLPFACQQDKEDGACGQNFSRFFYNKTSAQCQEFIYGGCEGNDNNFQDLEDCEAVCRVERGCPPNSSFSRCFTPCPLTCENHLSPPEFCVLMCNTGCKCHEGYVLDKNNRCVLPEDCPIETRDTCGLPLVKGPCKALFPRYYYNRRNNTCNRFYYGGCRGNNNNFRTLEECVSTCTVPQLPFACQQDKEVGACGQNFTRFFYNRTSAQCQEFLYGGCEGNDNNFQDLEDCEAVCRVRHVESNEI